MAYLPLKSAILKNFPLLKAGKIFFAEYSPMFIYQINSQSSPPYYVALILPIIMDGDTNFWRERQIILRIYVI